MRRFRALAATLGCLPLLIAVIATLAASAATVPHVRAVPPAAMPVVIPAGGAVTVPKWTAIEASGAADSEASVLGVACASASRCVAVGADETGLGSVLLLTSVGRSWTKRTVALPPGAARGSGDSALQAIACPGSSACVAVGGYQARNAVLPLIVIGSGPSWHGMRPPLPANAAVGAAQSAWVDAVACSSAMACVAAGSYTDKSGNTQGLLLTGHGTAWKATQAPLGPGPGYLGASLLSASCASAASCAVAGSVEDQDYNRYPLLFTWSGKVWTKVALKLPGGGSEGGLTGVSCARGGGCGAVGSQSIDNGDASRGLLVTGSGTKWTAVAAAKLTGSGFGGQSIACPTVGHCVTVGPDTSSSSTAASTALAVYSGYGTKWTVVKAALPTAGSTVNETGPIACTSPVSCAAAGSYILPSSSGLGEGEIYLLFYVGSSWRSELAPLPANDIAATLDSQGGITVPEPNTAACPTPSTCVVGGTYAADTGMAGLILSGAA